MLEKGRHIRRSPIERVLSGRRQRIAGATLAPSCTVIAALAAGLPDKDEAFIGARRNYWAFRKPVQPVQRPEQRCQQDRRETPADGISPHAMAPGKAGMLPRGNGELNFTGAVKARLV